MNDVKQVTFDVLRSYFLCVVSTVTAEAKPEAAIVGYVANDNLELLIGTSNHTRKFTNLQQNPSVAIALGDTKAEVQYEGVAKQVSLEEAMQQFGKTPGTNQYRSDPDQTWWLITPSWLRLTVHGEPNRIEEIKDFA